MVSRVMSKRIYIIAGEASGDLHGGNLAKALFNEAAEARSELIIRAWGGDRMAAAGAEVFRWFFDRLFAGGGRALVVVRLEGMRRR